MPELEISFHPKKEKSRKMRSRSDGQRKKRIWRQWISAERISHAVLDI
jgi:hypothetical protein